MKLHYMGKYDLNPDSLPLGICRKALITEKTIDKDRS